MLATAEQEVRRPPIVQIKDLVVGEEVLLRALVRSVARGTTRDRRPYLTLTLSDATGEVTARLWDAKPSDEEALQNGAIVGVKARVEEWNSTPTLKILMYKVLEDHDPMNFISRTPYNAEQMWQEIERIADSIEHPGLRKLLRLFLDDPEVRRRYKIWAAASKWHHAYAEGFLEHVYRMVRGAERDVQLYPGVDRDLLLTAVLLHDIGKLWGYTAPPAAEYTTKEELLGHIVYGCLRIFWAAYTGKAELPEKLAVEGLDEEMLDLLLHCVVSHHGKEEWGSPKPPLTDEAKILHYLDLKDSRIGHAEYLRRQRQDQPGKLDQETYFDGRERKEPPEGYLVELANREM